MITILTSVILNTTIIGSVLSQQHEQNTTQAQKHAVELLEHGYRCSDVDGGNGLTLALVLAPKVLGDDDQSAALIITKQLEKLKEKYGEIEPKMTFNDKATQCANKMIVLQQLLRTYIKAAPRRVK
jgi:hypothetical protein